MKTYEDGIDFIVVIFYRFEYARLLVESIKQYVKGIDYTVYIANNGINEGPGNGYDILSEMFKDNPNVVIIKGVDQTPNSNVIHHSDHVCKIDGRGVAIGSYTQVLAMDKAVRAGNRKYLCYQDADTIFLNEWVDDIIPLLDDNFFVSHMWRGDLGIQKDQFMTIKRENIENNYLYEKDDLYPNIHYKDTCGTLALYCQERNVPFLILKNSYNDRSLREQHLIPVPNGEQAWINGTPVVYHYGRGSGRADELYKKWIHEASKYLKLTQKEEYEN